MGTRKDDFVSFVGWARKDDFVSFVGWASCPSCPPHKILIFLDFWADRMSTPQDFDFPGFLGGQDVHPTRF
ncbi:hypothetical protein H6F39_14180 [Anabaena sp. FACHB-1250]|uniref:hypothetical protein n=1 Tax=unclassified Anabaena TaxID=2619674 RepID=UPI0016811C53|nr:MULTISPECIES: hypothetical protein [unclassified Anabaena]MBD2142475.1 hypothetical protein [Anabaena sp. FACHB-1250]MBD2269342.1 hypothetical protein [Anabaena sp. FACHB-1391]